MLAKGPPLFCDEAQLALTPRIFMWSLPLKISIGGDDALNHDEISRRTVDELVCPRD